MNDATDNSAARPAEAGRWSQRIRSRRERIGQAPEPVVEGRLTRVVGLTMEAAGCEASLGSRCQIVTDNNQ
ncbi:MAG: flagellum-specific ATP synthase FliI, partial [Gammaproteobacteria bacterium]